MIPVVIRSIYERPEEMPAHYVVRSCVLDRGKFRFVGGLQAFVAIEDAREMLLADGLVCVGRQPTDDPKLVESWL